MASAPLPSPARRLVPLGAAVFAALESGAVAAVERAADGGWLPGEPCLLPLGARPVSCLLPIGGAVYAGCGRQVSVIDAETREVVVSVRGGRGVVCVSDVGGMRVGLNCGAERLLPGARNCCGD